MRASGSSMRAHTQVRPYVMQAMQAMQAAMSEPATT
jgi:hypothetical protein